MKSLIWLLSITLTDVSVRCSTDTSRDLKTISRRVKHEGDSFLKIQLPDFCKDFERSLAEGRIDPTSFKGFRKMGASPVLFRGLLDLVFDRESGVLLQSPSHESIRCIRQVCRMFGKIREPSNLEKERKCYEDYIAIDNEVGTRHLEVSYRDFTSLYFTFSAVFGRVCAKLEQSLQSHILVPRHGPGAVAERITGNRKYELRTWPKRLEEYFPSDQYCISSMDKWEDLQSLDFAEPEDELPVRVISVPKTAKGPRIIAIEPLSMQYAQQALLQELVPLLESDRRSSKIVRFTSQAFNRKLALSSSSDGKFATIDLKDASDRVSLDMVRELFRSYPILLGALEACRSSSADVPGHGVIALNKFASMGSALCFPIEAMVFATLVVAAIANKRSESSRLSCSMIDSILSRTLSVYGDDIIVPVDEVLTVMTFLRKFGIKVNEHKSFWTGKFRESCGQDAYDGEDVTPCYVRHPMPQHGKLSLDWCNLIDFRNRMYYSGYWQSVKALDSYISDNIGYIPFVSSTSPGIGRASYLTIDKQRWNALLHRFEVKCPVICTRKRRDLLNGNPALLKFFLSKRSNLESLDSPISSNRFSVTQKSKLDFERHTVARNTYISCRWVTP